MPEMKIIIKVDNLDKLKEKIEELGEALRTAEELIAEIEGVHLVVAVK